MVEDEDGYDDGPSPMDKTTLYDDDIDFGNNDDNNNSSEGVEGGLISELLSLTPNDDDNNDDEREAEGEESIEAKQARLNDERRKEEIVTNLLNGAINARDNSLRDNSKTTLREALKTEDLPPATVSRLASSLARLMMPSRYSTSSSSSSSITLTDNDHGEDDDGDGGGAALTRTKATVSTLSLNSALLYAELLGTDGAWTAGFVDISAIIAIRSLLRRWCVDGIRNGSFAVLKKKRRGRKPPATKRSKAAATVLKPKTEGSRKSVRISELMMNDDNDSDYDDNDDVGDDDNDNNVELAAKNAAILGGPRLALAIGRASQNTDYSNWSTEAREFYLDTACVALGMCSALSSMSGGCDEDVNKVCHDALASLDHALCTTILFSPATTTPATRSRSTSWTRTGRRSGSSGNVNETLAREQRMRESGLHLLRGLLPLFHLKIEVPNGHAGKLAAYETAAALLVNVISSLSEMSDVEEPPVIRGRSSGIDDTSSATPKRGGRKSVGFAHTPVRISTPGITPDSSDDFLVPPSLKKSVTPRLTRSASLRLSDQSNIRLHRHPVLTLVVGLLQRLLTTGGLEKADARSRACALGVRCLENLPTYERGELLRFVGVMCESKVSCHRLLGVELIGEVLCMGWFWRDIEKNTFVKTPGVVVRMSEGSSEASTSSTLLEALQGRLSDKSPTVRTRAAQSIGQVVEKACTASEERRNLDGTMRAETPNRSVPSRALIVHSPDSSE
jgi:hypothetical protein